MAITMLYSTGAAAQTAAGAGTYVQVVNRAGKAVCIKVKPGDARTGTNPSCKPLARAEPPVGTGNAFVPILGLPALTAAAAAAGLSVGTPASP